MVHSTFYDNKSYVTIHHSSGELSLGGTVTYPSVGDVVRISERDRKVVEGVVEKVLFDVEYGRDEQVWDLDKKEIYWSVLRIHIYLKGAPDAT